MEERRCTLGVTEAANLDDRVNPVSLFQAAGWEFSCLTRSARHHMAPDGKDGLHQDVLKCRCCDDHILPTTVTY